MEREHLLSLKVMRLTRPTCFPPLVVNCEPRDLPGDLFAQESANDCALSTAPDGLQIGQLLLLPQSFGDIYLGETFSCYISIHNDGKEVASDVNIKVDLQTSSLRQSLYGQGSNTGQSLVAPGDNKDIVINHEIKEGGVHMLVCAVNYSATDGEKLHFRKLFKFQVNRPLDVKTKFYNAESDKVFLEAQVQNLTAGPICLEKVALDPSPIFEVEQLNTVQTTSSNQPDDQVSSVFGPVNYVASQDIRQYLYCLSPKPEVYKKGSGNDSAASIGRLDIVWRSSMGETGRLQTSTLQKMTQMHSDVQLTVEEIPNIVTLEHPFQLTCRITNCSERTIDLILELTNKNDSGIRWIDNISGQKLGTLQPDSSTLITLKLIALLNGLQTISGLLLVDMFLRRKYEHDDLAQVFVVPEETVQ